MDYISDIMQSLDFKDGRRVLEKALHDVCFYGPLSTKQLARRTMLPLPVATALKNECIKRGIMRQEPMRGVNMTMEGKRHIDEDLGFAGIDRQLYLQLLDGGEAAERLVAQLSEEHRRLFQERPTADVTIDQAQCTVQTAFRRALLCLRGGTLIGKSILCLGDDDFVSVALGLLLKRLFPGEETPKADICVADMDERFVQCIRHIAETHRLPIRQVHIDLRHPLPTHMAGRFDCVFTDPPYTQEGAALFLSRAVSALKPWRGLRIYFSFSNKPADETFRLQQCILLHGLTIGTVLPYFNEYEGAALLGNRTHLFLLETNANTRAVVPMAKEGRHDIYTADAHNRESTTHSPAGQHILADFYGCQSDKLDDTPLIRQYMHEAAVRSGATIVEECFHKFEPCGVSGVVVIQESHLTIHTWPEHHYASIDLFTCGKSINPWVAFDWLKEKLQCANVEYRDLSRDIRNEV